MPTHALQHDRLGVRVPQGARLRARLHGWRLDSELASGADPASSPQLAARAAWLRRRRCRDQLAAGLENIVRDCDRRRGVITAAHFAHCPTIRAARADLLDLAAELKAPRDLDPMGLALVRRLLVDGASPLHTGGIDRLRPVLAEIRQALGREVR